MERQLVEKVINGMKLHIIETEKYKTNTLVLHIKSPLRRDAVTKRALLPYVLQGGTESLPTRLEIRGQLDDLYGATLTADVSKKGENQILTLRMDVANEKYLQDQTPLLKAAITLLSEIIFKPIKENGVFQQSIVANEKRNLKQRIQSIFDDKIHYANTRLTEEMCKEERYGVSVWGYAEEIDDIDAKQLFEQYEKMLSCDQFNFYIVGDVNGDEICEVVEEKFLFPKRCLDPEIAVEEQIRPALEKEKAAIFEEQDVKQGKLHLGFRTNTTFKDHDYFSMQLFNGLFGGFSHSKLFINVREKASLAYYASSRYESHKGILIVMSGIECKNYQQALEIIKEQLKSMQKGNFTELEISQTKAVLKNQILETVDVAKGYIELVYHNEVSGKARSVADWLAGIEAVTKEEIIKVSEKVYLDTIYFLKGREENK